MPQVQSANAKANKVNNCIIHYH